jgi:probable DNA repair protein
MGWPGERTLASAEFQARQAWDDLLAHCASLQALEPRMHRGEALQALHAVAADTMFQAEASAAPIQILGLLEAAGQPFDHLWVTGLAAERWPAAPQPHPFLPIAWQRERKVPHATALQELEFARAITAQLARAAPDVVMSHAVLQDEHERAPSALIAPLPDWGGAIEPAITTAQRLFRDAPARETMADDAAPPIPTGTAVRGGAGLISAQSDCPFRAVSNYRLGARPWPAASEGLTPRERGILVHAALAAFWRDVHDQAAMTSLSDEALVERIASVVDVALAGALSASRWRRLPAIVAAGERLRLIDVVRNALERFDAPRPPFIVRDVELRTPLTLSGLTLRLYVDRVDQLAEGGIAIIDYKGGEAVREKFWFDERPQGPQLAVYAMALKQADPAVAIRAVAYVQLKAGELRLRGIAADPAAWPDLVSPSRVTNTRLPDWNAVEARWHGALTRLAAEIAEGRASVAPRHRSICRTCGLQPLCRIDAVPVAGAPR